MAPLPLIRPSEARAPDSWCSTRAATSAKPTTLSRFVHLDSLSEPASAGSDRLPKRRPAAAFDPSRRHGSLLPSRVGESGRPRRRRSPVAYASVRLPAAGDRFYRPAAWRRAIAMATTRWRRAGGSGAVPDDRDCPWPARGRRRSRGRCCPIRPAAPSPMAHRAPVPWRLGSVCSALTLYTLYSCLPNRTRWQSALTPPAAATSRMALAAGQGFATQRGPADGRHLPRRYLAARSRRPRRILLPRHPSRDPPRRSPRVRTGPRPLPHRDH